MRRCLLRLTSSLLIAALLTSCYPRGQQIEPKICYEAKPRDLRELKSPFSALLPYDKQHGWGGEYHMGVCFATDGDYYRAITSFKRALFELPAKEKIRKRELLYFIALSYYLGGRYCEAIETFELTALSQIDQTFPAYQELLVLLYDSYLKTCQCDKADFILARLEEEDEEIANRTQLGAALRSANFSTLKCFPEGEELLADYCRCKKSIQKAQVFSAILPGAGYLYVGQKSSALTAFLLNALFIWATVEFFRRDFYAAGIFTLSLETGWYFGGIWGAAEAAKLYNTRLYERLACPTLKQKRLYPILQLRWSF